jgi:hypothetical protein
MLGHDFYLFGTGVITKLADGTPSPSFTMRLRDWYTWGPALPSGGLESLHYYAVAREMPVIGGCTYVPPIELR